MNIDHMNKIWECLQKSADFVKIWTAILPVVWVLFISTEWWLLRKHYIYFHIHQDFRPNYKIAFDPRYLLSLLIAFLLWFFMGFLTSREEISNGVLFGSLICSTPLFGYSVYEGKKIKDAKLEIHPRIYSIL